MQFSDGDIRLLKTLIAWVRQYGVPRLPQRQTKRAQVLSGSSSSSVKLAQAPVAGIPARVGIVPGVATCTAVIKHPTTLSLVKLSTTFTVYNWDFQIVGADGDRVIQVSQHSDEADIVSMSCTNEADPALIVLYTP